MKQSLLVGLNSVDPHTYGHSARLRGPEKDVENMNSLLGKNGFANDVLTTQSATKGNILQSIYKSASDLKAGDTFVFYYSGHGGQVKDTNNDEKDGLDETLVAYDKEITDDEIGEALGKFKEGVKVVMISDSCNSGSNYLSPYSPAPRSGQTTSLLDGSENRNSNQTIKAQVIHFSAAKDGDTSQDTPSGGLFTNSLIKSFNKGNFTGYKGFFNALNSEYKSVDPRSSAGYAEVGQVSDEFRNEKPLSGGASTNTPPNTPSEPPSTPPPSNPWNDVPPVIYL